MFKLRKDIDKVLIAKFYQCYEHYNNVQFERYCNTNFEVGESYKIIVFLVVKPKTNIELIFDYSQTQTSIEKINK